MSDLAKIKEQIDASLLEALKNRRHGFHVLSLADSKPSVRTLVLRGYESKPGAIWFHSHYKSEKIKSLKENPSVCVMAYCRSMKVQLRMLGIAEIFYMDTTSRQKWGALSLSARRCYLADSPGQELLEQGSGYPEKFDQATGVRLLDTEYGLQNFSRIKVSISSIDYLHLEHNGHKRAYFTNKFGDWLGKWIVP